MPGEADVGTHESTFLPPIRGGFRSHQPLHHAACCAVASRTPAHKPPPFEPASGSPVANLVWLPSRVPVTLDLSVVADRTRVIANRALLSHVRDLTPCAES